MPTDDERREVAERLREKHIERTHRFEGQCVEDQRVQFLRDLNDCLPDGDSAFLMLADLIDPTCHPNGDWKPVSQTQKVRRLVCDCGYEFGVERENASPFDISIMCELPNFCPNCGARVMDGGER